jgi:catechol 2,3-dioxygenase-like lactoylglutathione lyase family enzyme
MDLALSHVFLTVHDPDAALAFYRDALGLHLHSDVENGGHRWIALTTPAQPGLEIVLVETHAGRTEQDGDALRELLGRGALRGAIFRTSDLDATFARMRAWGADVLQEPTDQPWGVRDCAIRDPSGNTVRISQAG